MTLPTSVPGGLHSWLAKINERPCAVNEVLDVLVSVEKTLHYDSFVTSAPPRTGGAPALKTPDQHVTRAIVATSFGVFIANMMERGWEPSNDVWFCRRVTGRVIQAVPEHDFEWVIHPQLIGFTLPRFFVNSFVDAWKSSEQDALKAVAASIASALPAAPLSSGELGYDKGFRDALESAALAMSAEQVPASKIAAVVLTTLDALGNNTDAMEEASEQAAEMASDIQHHAPHG
jgi:hypothetical protein